MTEELLRAYSVLDLEPESSPEAVRQAYLDLVRIWHPDRYQQEGERLRRRAEEKLKEITGAYERLRGLAAGHPPADPIPISFGQRWGYVNHRGETVIHPEFLAARSFQDGLAAVLLVDRWGFIDIQGEMKIAPLYQNCGDFSEGLAAVQWYGRWGYIDKTGAFAVQPRFQEAAPFQQGKAQIRLGTRPGILSRSGEVEFLRNLLGDV